MSLIVCLNERGGASGNALPGRAWERGNRVSSLNLGEGKLSQKPGFLDNLNLPIKSLRVQILNSDIDIENH